MFQFVNSYAHLSSFLLFIVAHFGLLCNGTILVNPVDTSVVEGQSTALYCEFQIDPSVGATCSWTKNTNIINISLFPGVYEWLGNSNAGNCSFRIIESSLERDDGSWRCEIPETLQTPGESSQSAKLTVYVQPSDPQMYQMNQSSVVVGQTLSISVNETASISCISRHGNPSPSLLWIFNSEDISSTKDTTAPDDVKKLTYKRTITLQRKFNKDDNGKILRCDLKHPTLNYTEKYTETTMDIQYVTTTVEILSPNYVVVDEGSGYSFVCKADGNPPANCEWMYKKADASSWSIISEECQYVIQSASSADVGLYMCLAGNTEKMQPSPEVDFELRSGAKNVVGIIAGVFGAILVVAVIILVVVVIRLRRRMTRKISEPISRMPSMAELNRLETLSSTRTSSILRRDLRDTTYMIPVPTEIAPLCPPSVNSDSVTYRDKSDSSDYYKINKDSVNSRPNAESNIYSDPHLYEEILDYRRSETAC